MKEKIEITELLKHPTQYPTAGGGVNAGKLEILFVDDEQSILDGLRQQLYPKRLEWNMRFVSSGADALNEIAQVPADIVVSDMCMSRMDGGQLLQEVLLRSPQTTRIILFGQTDQEGLLRHLGCIHQYLQKPCDPLQLCNAIERTFALNRLLSQPKLRLAASKITSLPAGTESYHVLTEELAKKEASVAVIADAVSRDPALAVKLMQFVNSAFFAMPRKITKPQDAVILLGIKTLQAIVIANRLFDFIDSGAAGLPGLAMLWKTSFEIGEAACRLAKLDGADESVQQQSRLAGLLSLIGRAILLTSNPQIYLNVVESAQKTERTLRQCEFEIFGATQDEVTAYGIGLWAFSEELVESVAYQSTPSHLPTSRRYHPVTYLHIAKSLRRQGVDHFEDGPGLDLEFITSRNLEGLLAKQRKNVA